MMLVFCPKNFKKYFFNSLREKIWTKNEFFLIVNLKTKKKTKKLKYK